MALIINTNIQNDTKSGYLADAKNIRGAYQVVKYKDDLDSLPTGPLVVGSLAYVSSQDGTYRYTGDSWELISNANYVAGTGIVFVEDKSSGRITISCNIATSDDIKW